jgi:putative FmdB family regulatory protein
MPHYEFVCNACKKTFSQILTIAEHDAEKAACPHCGSHGSALRAHFCGTVP